MIIILSIYCAMSFVMFFWGVIRYIKDYFYLSEEQKEFIHNNKILYSIVSFLALFFLSLCWPYTLIKYRWFT